MLRRKKKRSWQDLDARQRGGVGLAALVQVGLLLFALVDWFRRPGREMRGPKWLWLPLLFVNFAGPIAYLTVGRNGGGAGGAG